MKIKLLTLLFLASFSICAQTNLVPNGNFETWSSSSQPDNWYRYFSGFVSQSTSAQNGTSSTNMKVADGTFNYINSEFFPVVANKTYRITLYHKLVSGSFSAIDFSLYHKPGTFKEEIIKKTDATFSSTEWRKIEFDYTPTVSENIEVDIWTTGTFNSEILVDNVSVIDVATIGAPYTLIPDFNFEKKLIALGIDSGATDGKVLTSSISKLTTLDVSSSSITDLTGIQDFVGLTTLKCNSNQLTVIDVSKNVALTYLDCGPNKLTTLDVSKNTSLTTLDLNSNQLTALDVSKNLSLTYLDCYSNLLTALDVSKNISLATLYCYSNQLTTLDVSKNVALTLLYCHNNQLTALDVSKNAALRHFYCSSNKLLSLNLKNGKNNLMTTNIELGGNSGLSCILVDDVAYSNTNWSSKKDVSAIFSPIDCSLITKIPDAKFEDKLIALGIDTDDKNGLVANASIATITSLDVSNASITNLTGIQGFSALKTLNCAGNLLKKVDLSKSTALATLNCSNNPNLICIQVADVAYATANWATTKDATASFSLDCTLFTLIPDAKFEDKLIAIGMDKDGKNGKVATESIASVTSLNVSSSLISDLTGIQDFVALTYLNCGDNKLTAIDVSKNVLLESLICYSNQLTGIDVTKNVALKTLNVSVYADGASSSAAGQGKIESLDLSKNLALTNLNCSYNKITNLDVSNNVLLTNLRCVATFLSNIDVTKNLALKSLSIAFYENAFDTTKNGNFESIDISKNIALENLDCSFNKIINLDISNNIALKTLKCSKNLLTKLDLSKNSSLSLIECHENKLTSLDTSYSPNLYEIQCNNNQITTLDFSKNAKLNYLWCADNELSSLDITKNIGLIDLYCGKNLLSNLDITNNLGLVRLSCYSNNLGVLDVSKYLKLQTLECELNNLKTLDVTKNPALVYLSCSGNQLTTLDISKNTLLYQLSFGSNQLTTIDFSNNPKLFSIVCNNNLLTSLDISNSKSILYVNCNSNKLTYLNLKNGNSLYVSLGLANYKNNPDLKCIQVSNVAYAKQYWSFIKDATARFSEDCGGPIDLLSNNFTVESKGETCIGSNNGEINISAKETFSYVANFNGKSYPFTNDSLKVPSLAAGTYTMSITIPGENFEQNFTITIPKGANINGKSRMVSNKVSVEITEGTAPYTVFVDGVEQFETSDSNFSVETKKGGLLEVTTAKACEGTYAQDIAGLDGAVSAYPNPTSGSFGIEIPTSRKEVAITLYTLDGHLISTKTYTVENGKAQLSLENHASGVYVAKIELDTPNYLKIIKN